LRFTSVFGLSMFVGIAPFFLWTNYAGHLAESENWIQDAAAVTTSPKSIHTIATLSGSDKVDLTYLDYGTDLQYCQEGELHSFPVASAF
jgi:hypothetical protein